MSRQNDEKREILDMEMAAELLLISVSTLRKLVKAGKVPYYRHGKQYRFSRQKLEKQIQSGEARKE